jgi:hypothetical protein
LANPTGAELHPIGKIQVMMVLKLSLYLIIPVGVDPLLDMFQRLKGAFFLLIDRKTTYAFFTQYSVPSSLRGHEQ